MTGIVQTTSLGVFAAILSIAAWRDWQTLQIANLFPLTIAGIFAIWALSGYLGGRLSVGEVGLAAAGAGALLAVGAIAFAVGMLGGGDVKLLASAGLFAVPRYLVAFLLVVALAGGALSIAVLLGIKTGATSPDGGRRRLPYGPAIAAGGLWVTAARLFA
ncbi:MAG: prepilin peptidase [Reyranellaceae bacterium]